MTFKTKPLDGITLKKTKDSCYRLIIILCRHESEIIKKQKVRDQQQPVLNIKPTSDTLKTITKEKTTYFIRKIRYYLSIQVL